MRCSICHEETPEKFFFLFNGGGVFIKVPNACLTCRSLARNHNRKALRIRYNKVRL